VRICRDVVTPPSALNDPGHIKPVFLSLLPATVKRPITAGGSKACKEKVLNPFKNRMFAADETFEV